MENKTIEWAGKIAVLEHKVEQIGNDLVSIEKKLDELLTLRSKGQGAFWVATSLFGAGIVGVVSFLKNWVLG